MSNNGSDFSKSVLFNDFDLLPIDTIKLSDSEILQMFPEMNEEQLDKIKIDIITISQVLYNNLR